MTLLKLVEKHQDFAKDVLKHNKELMPQLILCKDNKIIATVIQGDRDAIKSVIEAVSKLSPDWLVFLTEAYMRREERNSNLDKYRAGYLAEKYESGDKTVQEVIIIQAYNSDGKLMRMLDKATFKQVEKDTEEFDGYLAVNDVDRIFWKDKAIG